MGGMWPALLALLALALADGNLKASPWKHLGSFPAEMGRIKACSCTYRTTLYVFGGQTVRVKALDSLAQLDLETLQVRTVRKTSPWPAPRYYCSLLCDIPRGTLYLIGGKDDLDDVWAFSVADETWRELPGGKSGVPYTPDTRRQGTDVAYANTDRYIVGAGSDDGMYSDYLTFDKETETWLEIKYEDRLRVEDAGATTYGHGSCAVMIGGTMSSNGAHMPPQALYLNTTEPFDQWEWRDLTDPAYSPRGEEFKTENLNENTIVVIGDPSGT
eukprot:Sspe_Gene.102246::Locus_77163_Transcript_1_1_Confidence_1.000_Length_854::g.102246::m.102246